MAHSRSSSVGHDGLLLDMLRGAQIDDERSLMHEVTEACCVQSLVMLSAANRWHQEHCRTRLQQLREQHKQMQRELACRLGSLSPDLLSIVPERWQLLPNVRALVIPGDLPDTLWPILGKWLRADGRLGQVDCVRCTSWVRTGETVGWIDLESLRADEPLRMSPEEVLAFDKLDTPTGQLKTVLKHARKKLAYSSMLMAGAGWHSSIWSSTAPDSRDLEG